MNGGAQVVIAKAGGSTERFSEAKLRRCFRTVLREAGCDGDLAAPLARAVGLHLSEQAAPDSYNTEYLFRCAVAVLQQTNLLDAARCLEAHRNHRGEARMRVRVFDPQRPKRGCVAWKKSTVVGLLENRYGVRHSVARGLACEIENRVLALGFRVVRMPLLVELVQNELMAWGLLGEMSVEADAEMWSKPVGSRWPQREE